MTKEQAVQRVELAYQVYEVLKQVPVNERSLVIQQADQFNQADWQEYYKTQNALGLDKCAQTNVRPY